MKWLTKILLASLLFIPIQALAVTSVPWSITNLTDSFIFPNLVNGSAKGVLVSASSTFNGNLSVSTLTNGNCVQAGVGGILVSASGACGTGSGTPGGLNLQVQYNNAGAFGGISGAVTNGTILNLTNPLLGGATLTTSVVNGVTLTTAGSATSYLNGTGAYSVPVGTVYTGTFPIQVTGTVISSLFSTTTNTGLTQGNLYVGSGGIFQTSATTSVTCTGNASCSPFTVIGASPITINVAAGTAASSTLLSDSNTFSGTLNTFSNTIKVAALSGFIGGNSGTLYGFATSTIKTSQLTNDAGFITSAVTSVGGTYPIISTGGNTPTISTAFGTTSNTGIAVGTLYIGSGGIFQTSGTSTPTVTAPITYSGTLGQFISGVSGAFGCTNASAGVTGCLTGTDYNTFNGKENVLSFTWPLIRSTNTITFGGLSTSTAAVQGNLPYFSGVNTFANVATTSVTCTGNASCTAFTAIGASPITINVAAGTAASSTLLGDTNTFSGTGNRFTTLLQLAGILDTASSTINAPLGLPSLSQGSLYIGSGALVQSTATGTVSNGAGISVTAGQAVIGSGLTITNTGVTSVATTYPLQTTGSTGGITLSTAFGTSSTIGVGNNLFLYTNANGVITGAASSSLSLPNSALQNSTISGVALGSNLNSLTHDSTLTGTSYNGSASVSNWGFDLTHPNSWTGLQTFVNASSTLFSTTYASSTNYFGANLATCTGTSAVTWAAGLFGCTAIPQGTVTTVTASFPIISSGGATPNITFGGLSTTTNLTQGQIPYVTGVNTFGQVATGTVSNGTGISVTAGQSVIGSGLTITNTGVTSLGNGTGTTCAGTAPGTCNVNTTQNITTLSNLTSAGTVNTTASGVIYSTGTSTITNGSGIAYSGTMGSEIGGVSGTLSVSGLSGTNFSNVSANTVFANGTGASAAPTFIATSTFFGTPTPGTVLAFLNGQNTFVATTTDSCSSGIACSFASGVNTFTNTGVTSIVAGTNITVSGATGAVTINASGGSGTYPFTPSTDGGINTSATSTPIQGTNPGLGLDVSPTSWYGIGGRLLAYASSTNHASIFGIGAGGQNATTTASLRITDMFGFSAGKSITTGTSNAGFGELTLAAITTGTQNVAVGTEAMTASTLGSSNNVAVGYRAGAANFLINGEALVGSQAGAGLQSGADNNTFVGAFAGANTTTGYGNTLIGSAINPVTITTGNNNINLGAEIFNVSNTQSNQLNIGNVIFGTIPATTTAFKLPTSGSIGIGTSSPFAKFSIQTNNGDTSQVLFAIGSSTQTATTTLIAADNTGALSFFNTLGSWITKNINGNLFFASSTSLFNATSTFADPNIGYIEFPSNGGCIGCTDIVLGGGINLRNAKYVNATTTSGTANSFIDDYTAPAGRRALVVSSYMNPFGGTIAWTSWVKDTGVFYRLTASTSAGGLPASQNIGFVLEPGETLSTFVNSASANNLTYSIIEYDASVPFYSPKVLSPVSGTTTLYSAPTGVTANVLSCQNPYTAIQTSGAPSICFGNGTQGSATAQIYLAKSGQPLSQTSNLIAGTVSASVNAMTPTTIGPNSLLTRNSGDTIQYSLTASLPITGTGAIFWVDVNEH